MAVVTHGGVLPDSSQKTDFYGLIDNATVSSIVDADISSGASIQDSKLGNIVTAGKVNTSALTGQVANTNLAQLVNAALVSGAALTLLPNIPSGAGIIPSANVGALLGAWVSKSTGVVFQALTDGFVVGYSTANTMVGITDSSSTPSTQRVLFSNPPTGFMMPVKKNDYWEVTSNGSATVFFISLGA